MKKTAHSAQKVKNHLPINYFLIDSSICSPFLVCVLRTLFLPSSDGSRATVESTKIKKSQNQTRRENLQRVKKTGVVECGSFFSIDFSLLPLDPAREIFGRQFMKLRARSKWIHEPHRKKKEIKKVACSDSNRHTKQLAILIHNLSTMPKCLWWRKKRRAHDRGGLGTLPFNNKNATRWNHVRKCALKSSSSHRFASPPSAEDRFQIQFDLFIFDNFNRASPPRSLLLWSIVSIISVFWASITQSSCSSICINLFSLRRCWVCVVLMPRSETDRIWNLCAAAADINNRIALVSKYCQDHEESSKVRRETRIHINLKKRMIN